MADGRDPKIVIRTEYDPKGIQKLLADSRAAAKQLGVIQNQSVRQAEAAEARKLKASAGASLKVDDVILEFE